ncbi:hypothetical protein BJ878DRAFT_486191 [Calycina marina]|uniref:Uncharacterized protein n=1 Tax=Calycina marina TaxID=1763456 RepID=A0A9P7ZCM1_9HELO|nr:hypothetical protein BJ878DRAFT_486191 [Calycina marina]
MAMASPLKLGAYLIILVSHGLASLHSCRLIFSLLFRPSICSNDLPCPGNGSSVSLFTFTLRRLRSRVVFGNLRSTMALRETSRCQSSPPPTFLC